MLKLKRDSDFILSNLVEKDEEVLTKKDTKIMVPVHFEDKKLLNIGKITQVVGYFPIIMEDKYAVMSVMAKVKLPETAILGKETIDNVPYYTFTFPAGSVFLVSKHVFNQEELMFITIDEFIIHGKVPWYMSYDDIGKFIQTSNKYTGVKLLPSDEVGEALASMVARDPNNRFSYYRLVKDKSKTLPSFIPMDSALFGATNTVSRVIGSRFSDGVLSSLAVKSDTVENIEALLRI